MTLKDFHVDLVHHLGQPGTLQALHTQCFFFTAPAQTRNEAEGPGTGKEAGETLEMYSAKTASSLTPFSLGIWKRVQFQFPYMC